MGDEHSVAVAGATLHCRVDGRAGAPWLVFGNSLLTDLSIWDAQVAAFEDRYAILRYDQRGHGQSTVSEDPLTFQTLGRDLVTLLEGFGIDSCTYVGLSMGVPTGLAAHGMAPGRFAHLVFVDGMARTAPAGAASWEERIRFATAEGMERMAAATAARWLQPEAAGGPAGARLRGMLAATPLAGFVQCARALQRYDYAEEVGRIRGPLHAIAGACDGAMPDTMERVFGPVAAAPVARIGNAGHVPNFEQPEAFNEALRACLESSGT